MTDRATDTVVVIGSGPTGATAAARLVELGVGVTMLDAGTHAPRGALVRAAGNTLLRYSSQRELEGDRLEAGSTPDIEWTTSRSLGGLSNYWTAAVPRFAPEDFDEGARLDERYRWPVTYDDLVEHYAYAERLLRVTAGVDPIPGVPSNDARFHVRPPGEWRGVVEQANAKGHGLGMIPMAKGSPWMIARRAREFASYHCVVAPLLGGAGFELRRGARVTGLRWNASAGRVDAVEYVDVTTGELVTLPCAAVVLAAGAVDSTVLLLRSTSPSFPRGLGNEGGIVGRYLHDHPKEWYTADTDRALRALAHPVYIAREPGLPTTPLMATSLTLGLPRAVARLKTYVRGSEQRVGVQVFGTMVPPDEVGISIDGSGPGSDVRPRMQIAYDQAALDNLACSRERLRAVLADGGVAVEPGGQLAPIRPGASVHHGGTIRMHESPAYGALDGRGRLHEVPNVAVGDASAFTTGPEKNPTLTAMALAGRAATLLAADLRAGRIG